MEWIEYCKSFSTKVEQMYKQRVGGTLNLSNPQTLTEKIQWLKLYDSTYMKSFCADKIKLHEYCKRKLNKDICIPILAIYETPDEIQWDSLPNQFVIKCNHGSGYNIIVKDKTAVNKSAITDKLRKWLNEDYGLRGYELHYSLITRKIFIEEYKSSNGQADLTDYKLFCFNGTPSFWQIITDRRSNEHISHYDMNWTYSPQYDWKKYNSCNDLAKPNQYDEMVQIATILCADFKFVRVDFYVIDNQIYLGELTFTPADGFQIFRDSRCDYVLGQMLKIK